MHHDNSAGLFLSARQQLMGDSFFLETRRALRRNPASTPVRMTFLSSAFLSLCPSIWSTAARTKAACCRNQVRPVSCNWSQLSTMKGDSRAPGASGPRRQPWSCRQARQTSKKLLLISSSLFDNGSMPYPYHYVSNRKAPLPPEGRSGAKVTPPRSVIALRHSPVLGVFSISAPLQVRRIVVLLVSVFVVNDVST